MNKYYAFLFGCICMTNLLFAQDTKPSVDQPSGKFTGQMFGDLYYNAIRDTNIALLKNTANGGTEKVKGFQFRRINLTYDYKYSKKLSLRFRVEADEAQLTVKSSGTPDKMGIYMKDAFLKWSACKHADIVVGLQDPPVFNVQEPFWGNRFLEKSIVDLRGYVASRDMGISLRGKTDSLGTFKYVIMYANNAASKPETDPYKRYYGNIEYSPSARFSVSYYLDYKTQKPIKNKYTKEETTNNGLTTVLCVGFREKGKYTTGVEAVYNVSEHGFDTGTELTDKNGMGVSVFGMVNLSEKIAAVARYDYFEPNNNSNASSDIRHFIIAGVNYYPHEKITVSPNIVFEAYEKKPTVNYKSSVTPRISFNWLF